MAKTFLNSDYQFVDRLRSSDKQAFDKLFNKYSGKLYSFSLKYLKSIEEAEGVVQSVFMYIWENRENLKPHLSFNAYLYTIAYNIIKKRFLKRAQENALKDEILYTFLKSENSLDKIIDYKFLLEKVEQIIELLPPKRKEVFIKRKYEGLHLKEIADQLNISPNTVENHLAAAQKQILRELKKEKIADFLFFIHFLMK